MARYDVFNGDADGICALTQFRLAHPADATLITGVKRDISLVKQIEAEDGDEITVLDVSLDKNREGVQKVLDQGATVLYVDHHFPGDIPVSSRFVGTINTASDVCTSILVNTLIGGRFRLWAVAGAFGDNLDESARRLGRAFDEDTLATCKAIGTYINYNGYGKSLDDLHFAPADLYRTVSRHESPLAFQADDPDTFGKLEAGYHDDMGSAEQARSLRVTDHSAAFVLPDEKWARRVSGVYSNGLARKHPSRAHAVLTERADGTYLVSVRAPLHSKWGADEICRAFPTGGGRKAAAGINALPSDMLDTFLDKLDSYYAAARPS